MTLRHSALKSFTAQLVMGYPA